MITIIAIGVVLIAVLGAMRNIVFGGELGAKGLKWYQGSYGENDLKGRRLEELFTEKAKLLGPNSVLIYQPTLRRDLPIVDVAYLERIRRLLIDEQIGVAVIGTWKPDADVVENDELFADFRDHVNRWMGDVAHRVEVVNLWERGGALVLDQDLFKNLETFVSPRRIAAAAADLERRRQGRRYRIRSTSTYQTAWLALRPSHNGRIVKRMIVNLIGSRMVEQHLQYRGWIAAPTTQAPDEHEAPNPTDGTVDDHAPVIYLAWELEFSRESTLERLTHYRLRSTMMMGRTISYGRRRVPLPVDVNKGAVRLVGENTHLDRLGKRQLTCADRLLGAIIESIRESGFGIPEHKITEIEGLRGRNERVVAKCNLLETKFLGRTMPEGEAVR